MINDCLGSDVAVVEAEQLLSHTSIQFLPPNEW